MRRTIGIGLGLILSIILMGSQTKPFPDQLLFQTIQQLNGKVELVNYHFGSRVTDWMSTAQMDSFVQQLANELNCLSIQKRQQLSGVYYQAERRDQAFITRLQVLNDQPDQPLVKPYVSIQIRGSGSDPTQSVYQQLSKFLLKHHFSPNIHFTLQGSIPTAQGSKAQLIARAFQFLHAKEIEGINTKQLISSSAMSDLLPDYGLKTQNGKMNVQAAAKINRKKNQFLFTIGSPIITIEY
mgnify:CR=1 FL=1